MKTGLPRSINATSENNVPATTAMNGWCLTTLRPAAMMTTMTTTLTAVIMTAVTMTASTGTLVLPTATTGVAHHDATRPILQ
jgi:hypothetical protein